MKVAIVGYGVVGQAYSQLFPDAVIYDPYSDKLAKSWIDTIENFKK